MKKTALLILGNQLFPLEYYQQYSSNPVFMAEDHGLCTHFKYHKHKLILFLSAMRHYSQSLSDNGFNVHYHELNTQNHKESFEDKLQNFVDKNSIQKLICYEIEDLFFDARIHKFCESQQIELEVLTSPLFLCTRAEFQDYLKRHKKPFMKTFYEQQRRQQNILMDDGKPRGGQFSFDADNRKKLPAKISPPPISKLAPDEITQAVIKLIEELFPDHPGEGQNFWLPVTRSQALDWMQNFFQHRFEFFGDYEDAITNRSDFVYHSVLSPIINLGLLTPQEVLEQAIDYAEKNSISLNSLEGFVRQIMGWREFVRGIYQNYDTQLQFQNFFDHQRKLTPAWYQGELGIPPIDDAIKKAIQYGYNHHIERLMLLSNLMLLCEIHPQEVYRWFMEMYVDSSDWVMSANVFDMGQFAAGGIFATKPYICGSNYIRKMSSYPKGDWCDILDGLYWRFIDRHQKFFARNHRMGMMIKSLQRMDDARKQKLFRAADEFIEMFTN